MSQRRGRRPAAVQHSAQELVNALKFFSTQGMKAHSQVHFSGERAVFDTSQARYFRYLPGIDWRITIDGHRLLKTIEKQTQQLTFHVSNEASKLSIVSASGSDVLPCAPFDMVTAEPTWSMHLPEGTADALIVAGELAKTCGSAVHLRQGNLIIASQALGAVLRSNLPEFIPNRELGAQALARIAKMKNAPLIGIGPVRGNDAALGLFFGTPSDASSMQIGRITEDSRIDQMGAFLLQSQTRGHASEVPPSFWEALAQLRENAQDDLCRFENQTEPTVCSGDTRRAVAIPVPAGAYFSLESLLSLKSIAKTVEFENDNGWQLWFRGEFGLIGCLRSIAIGNVDSMQTATQTVSEEEPDTFTQEGEEDSAWHEDT